MNDSATVGLGWASFEREIIIIEETFATPSQCQPRRLTVLSYLLSYRGDGEYGTSMVLVVHLFFVRPRVVARLLLLVRRTDTTRRFVGARSYTRCSVLAPHKKSWTVFAARPWCHCLSSALFHSATTTTATTSTITWESVGMNTVS